MKPWPRRKGKIYCLSEKIPAMGSISDWGMKKWLNDWRVGAFRTEDDCAEEQVEAKCLWSDSCEGWEGIMPCSRHHESHASSQTRSALSLFTIPLMFYEKMLFAF